MATIHLLHGPVGSFKNTFAKKLEQELGCVHFSLDEWMIALHGYNPLAEDFHEEEEKVKKLIWSMVVRILATGQDVIIDFGIYTHAQRDTWRERAEELNVALTLYSFSYPDAMMKPQIPSPIPHKKKSRFTSGKTKAPRFIPHIELVEPVIEKHTIVQMY